MTRISSLLKYHMRVCQCTRRSKYFHLEMMLLPFGTILGKKVSSERCLSGVLPTFSRQGKLISFLIVSDYEAIPKVSSIKHE